MELIVNLDDREEVFVCEKEDKYYSSDSIEHGRSIKKFFYALTDNFFQKSFESTAAYFNQFGEHYFPLMASEISGYAHFANSLSTFTNMYMSEVPLNKSDEYKVDNNRCVDFWAMLQDGEHGKRLNYFIELKKSYYCTSEGTSESVSSNFKSKMDTLVKQIQQIKNAETGWHGDGNVFLGLMVVHGYHNKSKSSDPDSARNILESTYEEIDKRTNAQLLMNTVYLSNGDSNKNQDLRKIEFVNGDICEFISFIGIVITTKR